MVTATKRHRSLLLLGLAALLISSVSAHAQIVSRDPAARLREVLPTDVAARVLARIADARNHRLPAEALENRALKFAAKGVDPLNIERSVNEQAGRMQLARAAILSGRALAPADDEIEAGAEAMRKGVDGAAVSLLARSAPSGRSLAVPLFVIGSLTDRGLPSDVALQRVLARLKDRASDRDLEALPGNSADAPGHSGDGGREFGQSHRPANSGRPASAGPPAGVPGNGASKHVKSVSTHPQPASKGHK
ncbi:MAG TPA: hypothetical protein VGG76_08730 [Gemmatimonadaceae bacterium]